MKLCAPPRPAVTSLCGDPRFSEASPGTFTFHKGQHGPDGLCSFTLVSKGREILTPIVLRYELLHCINYILLPLYSTRPALWNVMFLFTVAYLIMHSCIILWWCSVIKLTKISSVRIITILGWFGLFAVMKGFCAWRGNIYEYEYVCCYTVAMVMLLR